MPFTGHCQCGRATFEVEGKPLIRLFCHCTICQAFNNAPFADICLYPNKRVALDADQPIDFKAYRKPPAVQRGQCTYCEQPAIERFELPALPDLFIIPSANLVSASPEQNKGITLPAASCHMFYDSRTADINDGLPKYSGYWPSHLGSAFQLIKSLSGRGG